MKIALEKLEQLTSKTGINFSSQKSQSHKILKNLPDPQGAITRLSLLVDSLASNFSETEVKNFFQHYGSREVFVQIATLFSNSPILSYYFTKNPQMFEKTFPLQKVQVETYEKELNEKLYHWLSRNDKEVDQDIIYSQIREEKVRQFILIALSDYLGLDTFEETVTKITLFAEMSIRYALRYSGLHTLPFAVIAMGKLGGQELNYNSDIDLMFVTSNTMEKVFPLEKIFHKIYRFVDILDRLTADGFVFKVDLRIRPEGNQGPLCLTLKQYHRYYQNRAQSWEFQALIKARAVGGDEQLGKEFENFRKQFVFNPDFSSKKMLFSIARIKNTIENFHNSQGYNDVKLSPGGIRDLEFTVQFLQIHHGKITRFLGSSNTLSTLDKFLAYNLITVKQHRDFKNHYCFLRRIEHYLQLIDLQPVRNLPSSHQLLNILSRMLGFENKEEFIQKVKKVMDYNHNLFVRVFNLTVAFYEKIEEIHKQIQSWEKENLNTYVNFFEQHIGHLESDYFLNFETPIILDHIKLLKHLTEKKSHLEITLNLGNGDDINRIQVNLVTYDHAGIFSLICAVFSVYGINIQNGASFLYQSGEDSYDHLKIREKKNNFLGSTRSFSSQLFWKKNELIREKIKETKKVVFAMEGFFIHAQARRDFNPEKFQMTLTNTTTAVKKGDYAHTMEELLLHSLESMKKYGSTISEEQLKPIQLRVNNNFHPLYTVVDILSEDSFLFLFFFTYALSYKDYYIIKVEFTTPKNQVRNRIFLTDKKREKIQSAQKILELKSSILMIKYFSTFMAYAPNPALAYKTFNRLIEKTNPTESKSQNYHEIFRDLAKVLGTTETIMEDFLRLQHHDLQSYLGDREEIANPLTPEYLNQKMEEAFSKNGEENDILNAFKDKYLFHLDIRLLTGVLCSFEDFFVEMCNLTDIVMTKVIDIALHRTLKKFSLKGEPGRHAIIALGKWGSREMGYSSDVELVFVYDGPRGEEGKVLSHVKEFYIHLGNLIPEIIRNKKNGVFELDLRLRPGGDAGMIAVSIDRYRSYYEEDGGYLNYEKMVLTRLRIVYDSGGLGKEIFDIKEHFVYELGDFDLSDYFSLRKKQIENLVIPKNSTKTISSRSLNLKFSPGGLVEIEYLLQILSIFYGRKNLHLRKNNTLEINQSLFDAGIIDQVTYKKLQDFYRFLRNIINCVRIIRGNAKDMLLPERDSLEMEYLKRTMVNFHSLEENQDLFDTLISIMDEVAQIHNQILRSLK